MSKIINATKRDLVHNDPSVSPISMPAGEFEVAVVGDVVFVYNSAVTLVRTANGTFYKLPEHLELQDQSQKMFTYLNGYYYACARSVDGATIIRSSNLCDWSLFPTPIVSSFENINMSSNYIAIIDKNAIYAWDGISWNTKWVDGVILKRFSVAGHHAFICATINNNNDDDEFTSPDQYTVDLRTLEFTKCVYGYIGDYSYFHSNYKYYGFSVTEAHSGYYISSFHKNINSYRICDSSLHLWHSIQLPEHHKAFAVLTESCVVDQNAKYAYICDKNIIIGEFSIPVPLALHSIDDLYLIVSKDRVYLSGATALMICDLTSHDHTWLTVPMESETGFWGKIYPCVDGGVYASTTIRNPSGRDIVSDLPDDRIGRGLMYVDKDANAQHMNRNIYGVGIKAMNGTQNGCADMVAACHIIHKYDKEVGFELSTSATDSLMKSTTKIDDTTRYFLKGDTVYVVGIKDGAVDWVSSKDRLYHPTACNGVLYATYRGDLIAYSSGKWHTITEIVKDDPSIFNLIHVEGGVAYAYAKEIYRLDGLRAHNTGCLSPFRHTTDIYKVIESCKYDQPSLVISDGDAMTTSDGILWTHVCDVRGCEVEEENGLVAIAKNITGGYTYLNDYSLTLYQNGEWVEIKTDAILSVRDLHVSVKSNGMVTIHSMRDGQDFNRIVIGNEVYEVAGDIPMSITAASALDDNTLICHHPIKGFELIDLELTDSVIE